ncbi:Cytosolic phospholipase A2-like protein [Hapsidospora chrysogenum ATCC 11550]|uniref:Lysophospholipase n=1 Tax=Hapsidospora chrysogenum (strain ATCC 11550 / CBS 779.69 / DSM 880 / IAM 14645 / JCM 23072 / IMI 49137) TaxID=857340 RepID=A0A086T5B3_HAPC1|nr:Cytosolic phospholipase A2-like protein [Hapsidospora chrysogenum ATCC 11550]
MRHPNTATRSLARVRHGLRAVHPLLRHSFLVRSRRQPHQPHPSRHGLFTAAKDNNDKKEPSSRSTIPLALITGALFIWWLYPTEDFAQLSGRPPHPRKHRRTGHGDQHVSEGDDEGYYSEGDQSAWANFAHRFESFTAIADVEWSALTDTVTGYILPDWTKLMPGYVRKLQRELSLAPGSLADEIWREAHDPLVNPEIRYSANVRVSSDLCDEEKQYLSRRKKVIRVALARYLGLPEEDIHPDDVPTIAVCGSGGGLRALIAGTGSLLATEEDGLLDCVTYTAGVSGTCWLQAFYLSSFTKGRIAALVDHLKARASTHIAYPPVAFQSLVSLPTSKYLLSGMVEKLKGDPKADFGLVDVYGVLLAARYLIPRGDLAVNERDFKLSNQRDYVKFGQNPLPIYTAVRHEIPDLSPPSITTPGDLPKEEAKKEPWFQWFEFTPYEFFCEELGAGIPTWAIGRKFKAGRDVPPEHGFHLPEIRVPLLLGVFGSAFCATLKHYYREIQPLVKSITGLSVLDEVISDKSDDLGKVHPIDPARIPNFAYQMQGKLAKTAPTKIYEEDYIQLMDAGMSNNLPIYPLLRPGRDVDVLVTFDASADVKTDNWLSVVEGYARQRGVKGWPVGIGWPRPGESAKQLRQDIEAAQVETAREAEKKVRAAKQDQAALRKEAREDGIAPKSSKDVSKFEAGDEQAGDLGYCTVWVGTTEERSSKTPPKAVGATDTWRLTEPDAGITVVYLPFLANDKVPGVSPGTSDFLSTWNFVYTPEQIDSVVKLARANYDEGKEQIRSTVRAVYERKKKKREEAERQAGQGALRSLAKRGEAALLGQGDQFS